jgi:hypothetical protein
MTDSRDLEASLAEMDRKLRELQGELELLSRAREHEPEPPPPPPPTPPAPTTGEEIEHAAARVAELGRRIDALADLRKELDNATSALLEEQRRAASHESSQ